MPNLYDCLNQICSGWSTAKQQSFSGNPVADFIRTDFVNTVQSLTSAHSPAFLVKGSAGVGNWAAVPWLSILHPSVTDSTKEGFYVVYLFRADGSGVYLSLNQGTTGPKESLGSNKARERSDQIKASFRKAQQSLDSWSTDIDLRSPTTLGRSYEPSNIAAKFYSAGSIPSNQILEDDLVSLLTIADNLIPTYIDFPTIEMTNDSTDKFAKPGRAVKSSAFTAIPKPFLILAGISGTGKSRWVRE